MVNFGTWKNLLAVVQKPATGSKNMNTVIIIGVIVVIVVVISTIFSNKKK